MFLAKLLTERKIVEMLRALSPVTDEVKDILSQEEPDFSYLEFALPIDIGNQKAYKLGIQHTRGVTIMSKIQYAFYQTIVLDILDSIGRYGYDPDLFKLGMEPSECANYSWYLA